MKKLGKPIACIVLSLILTISIFTGCQSKDTIDTKKNEEIITSLEKATDVERVIKTIEELSSKKYDGRLAGSMGNNLAGDYIANYFKEIGLNSPKGIENYKQPYTQTTVTLNSKPLLQIRDNSSKVMKEYKFLEDFNVILFQNIKINGESEGKSYFFKDLSSMTFGSNSSDSKILLFPKETTSEALSRDGLNKILSSNNGIKAIIFEKELNDPNNEVKHFIKSVYSPQDATYNNEGPSLLQVSSSAFKELTELNKNNSIYIKLDYTPKKAEVSNIVGIIEGSDNKLKDEYIILSGHFDHLGSNENGTYNPGALDNASGTAAIMEIARVLKEKNIKPKKSIMFIAFNGEEEGLYGSQYFATSKVCPSNDSAVINLDMVGHIKDNPLMLYYNKDSKLLKDMKKYFSDKGIKYITDKGDRSDHAPFSNKGMEAVTLIEYETAEYHSYRDTVDKINKEDISNILGVIYRYIFE